MNMFHVLANGGLLAASQHEWGKLCRGGGCSMLGCNSMVPWLNNSGLWCQTRASVIAPTPATSENYKTD